MAQIVEPLRHKNSANAAVAHARRHLVEDLRLHHVIAVHDHHDVVLGNVLGAARGGVDLGQYHLQPQYI